MKQQGSALIITILLLMIMSITAVSLLQSTSYQERMASNQKLVAEAVAAADSGIKDGVYRLVSQSVTDANNETSTTWTSGNLSTVGFNNGVSNSFVITHKVTNGAVVRTVQDKPYFVITSTGTSNGVTRTMESVVSLVYTNHSIFTKGLTGCLGLTLKGVSTSSFKTSDPTYHGTNGDVATLQSNSYIDLTNNADIGGSVEAAGYLNMQTSSNVRGSARVGDYITMSSNSKIFQDAMAGSGITGGTVYGNTKSNMAPAPVTSQNCDPLKVNDKWATADGINSGSGSNLIINSNMSFVDGVYDYNNLNINSNNSIGISGDVTLVVNGDFNMDSNAQFNLASGAKLTVYVNGTYNMNANAAINNPGMPANVVVYSNATSTSPTDTKVTIGANNLFNGVVYAPNAAVAVASSGSGNIQGAMWGKWIGPATSNSNFNFKYDEDLTKYEIGTNPTPTGFSPMYWSEK